jgi:hypothetical protein
VRAQPHATAALPPGKQSPTPLHRRLGGPRNRPARCGGDRNLLTLPGNLPKKSAVTLSRPCIYAKRNIRRTFQLTGVTSDCLDWDEGRWNGYCPAFISSTCLLVLCVGPLALLQITYFLNICHKAWKWKCSIVFCLLRRLQFCQTKWEAKQLRYSLDVNIFVI